MTSSLPPRPTKTASLSPNTPVSQCTCVYITASLSPNTPVSQCTCVYITASLSPNTPVSQCTCVYITASLSPNTPVSQCTCVYITASLSPNTPVSQCTCVYMCVYVCAITSHIYMYIYTHAYPEPSRQSAYQVSLVTNPCDPNPCKPGFLCSINHLCRHGDLACSHYICQPGCSVGDGPSLVYPGGSRIKVPVEMLSSEDGEQIMVYIYTYACRMI